MNAFSNLFLLINGYLYVIVLDIEYTIVIQKAIYSTIGKELTTIVLKGNYFLTIDQCVLGRQTKCRCFFIMSLC